MAAQSALTRISIILPIAWLRLRGANGSPR